MRGLTPLPYEFVAQTLMAKLADFGMVRRKDRQILDLGELIHFHTPHRGGALWP